MVVKSAPRREAGSPASVTLGASPLSLLPLALGGSWYATDAGDAERNAAMAAAYEAGIRHFDTAAGYARGRSEELLGHFLKGRRDAAFVASKSHIDDLTAAAMLAEVEGSLRRLDMDCIDLYYIHWPRRDRDMRPVMEGLERARMQGKIRAAGVSNFSVAQMQQVAEVGRIDAHQLGYNLIWRQAERDVIPYCIANAIPVIAYSALAHGILTGKFGSTPAIPAGDQRHGILPFRSDLWPRVHAGVAQLAELAGTQGLPLSTLAVRWILAQRGIHTAVVGARNAAQARGIAAMLNPEITASTFTRMDQIGREIAALMPDDGALFGYSP